MIFILNLLTTRYTLLYNLNISENKRLRKQIKSLEANIAEHFDKIAAEMKNPNPDEGSILHWAKEIETWKKTVARKRAKLPGGK